MDKIEVHPLGIVPSYSSSNAYTLVLAEVNGHRKIPIVIGEHEAQAIALDLEGIAPPRPLTHELLKNIMISYHINISEIIIEDFSDGIFYSKIILSDGEKEISIDARTSDSVALALKFKCPIYVLPKVLELTGILFEESHATNEKEEKEDVLELEDLTLEELNEMLKEAEYNEEYEIASKIQAEIEKRK